MLKIKNNAVLNITQEALRWDKTEHVIAYPIFIRDPAQQRQFLSAFPSGTAISLNFTKDLCTHHKVTYFGQRFTQIAPEKVTLITIQDILTRHGYVRGHMLADTKQIHHWASHPIGYLAWAIAILGTLINGYLFSTRPSQQPPLQTQVPPHTAIISPLLLHHLAELPGAIAQLDATPDKGHVQAYIPQDKTAAFTAYITQKSPSFPIKWRHKILGKTKAAFVWEGEWTQP